jgi:hypothetical protein
MQEGNQVMESVIERAAPAVELEKILDQQSATLAHTRDAMVTTNAELDAIITTKKQLVGTVGEMKATGETLATEVGKIDESTTDMTGLLGELPGATQRTHAQLSRINTDTAAINTELNALAKKMLTYGLPRAKGAPTG